MSGSNPYPYPVQLDLEGRRVSAFDFLGLPVYRHYETLRNYRYQDTGRDQPGQDDELRTDGGKTSEELAARRRSFMSDLGEAYHVYGEVRCQSCEDDGNVELATIDLTPADDVEGALELWNDHVRDVHDQREPGDGEEACR